MKKQLYFYLSILLSFFATAQVVQPVSSGNSVTTGTTYPIGTIVSNDFNSSDWTITGGGMVFNGTNCVVINGNDDFSTNYAVYNNYYNDLQDATFTATVVVGALNTNGIAFGFSSAVNATSQNLIMQLNTTSGIGSRIWVNNAFISNSAPSIGTISISDHIQMSCSYVNRTAIITAKNLTTGGATSTYTYSTPYTYPFTPTSWQCSMRFTIWNVGSASTCTISNFSVTTNQVKNLTTLFVGDSKTSGSGASSVLNTIWSVGSTSFVKECNAGPGDVTQDVINRLTQIISYRPKNVVLWIGCNDLRFAVSTATWQANYSYITSTLQNAGITVYHVLSAPENTQDVTSVNNYINARYSNVIDIYTPMWSGTGTGLNSIYNAGDGVHLNDAGYLKVHDIIQATYPGII
jgi:lysophospholipase L1-like esterase